MVVAQEDELGDQGLVGEDAVCVVVVGDAGGPDVFVDVVVGGEDVWTRRLGGYW